MSKKYYPEIDGLRALAVISVLLFHLNPDGLLPGGYIGVDVFFVISGYLIIGLIFKEMQRGTFSYFHFLERRIARLYPALLFVVFLILVAGFFIYNTAHYLYASKMIKYTLFSISNFKFMRQAGYWDVSSTSNPVLHTWSLGVEQQFYLIFPLVIYFVYKYFKTETSVIKILLIISSLSFLCSQVLSVSRPSANFYFTGSRLFELGIGGIIALTGDSYKNISNRKKELLLSLGLVVIIVCAATYYSDIKYHPGITTLPVVIASAFCLLYYEAQYTGYILRNNFSVYIGKISYSIYLIHWPLLVFYKFLIQKSTLSTIEQLVLLILTFLLSAFTYHFIENNYRRISLSLFSKTGKVFVSTFILIFTLNYIVYACNALPWRLAPYPKEVQELSIGAREVKEYSDWDSPHLIGDRNQAPLAIFTGDSYLGQYIEQIDEYFKRKHQSVLFTSASACTETHLYVWSSKSCIRNTKFFYESLDKHLPVIRINNWSEMFEYVNKKKLLNEKLQPTDANFQDIFDEIISQQKRGKNNILFILPPPLFTKDIDTAGRSLTYKLLSIDSLEKILYKSDSERVAVNSLMMELISQQPNMSYIETYDFFCKDSYCQNIDSSTGIFYYYNAGHLSRYGAKHVWDNIGDQVYDFIIKNNPNVEKNGFQEEGMEFLNSN